MAEDERGHSTTRRAVAREAERCLAAIKRFGWPVLRGRELWVLLGYGSERSYQRAFQAGLHPKGVRLYPIAGQKGMCTRTAEMASWLVSQADWEERISRLAALPRKERRTTS